MSTVKSCIESTAAMSLSVQKVPTMRGDHRREWGVWHLRECAEGHCDDVEETGARQRVLVWQGMVNTTSARVADDRRGDWRCVALEKDRLLEAASTTYTSSTT